MRKYPAENNILRDIIKNNLKYNQQEEWDFK